MSKTYRIGKCTTVDIEDGSDFLPPYYKVYMIEEYEGCPTVWFEQEFDTLEEAEKYVKEKL